MDPHYKKRCQIREIIKRTQAKKEAKNKTVSMLKLDNDVKIPAMTIFMTNSKYFNINDIDINKITVSEVRVFMKKDNLYKHYIFYEDGGKYIPLNNFFSKMLAGYYNEYRDEDGKYYGNVSKRMNFVISDNLVDKINEEKLGIEEELGIALQELFFEGEFNYYLKTKT